MPGVATNRTVMSPGGGGSFGRNITSSPSSACASSSEKVIRGQTSMAKVSDAASPSASVAVQVWAVPSIAAAGAPATIRVASPSATPSGNAGDSVQVGAPSPPVAAGSVKAAVSRFRVHVLSAISASPKVGTRPPSGAPGPSAPPARSSTVTSTPSPVMASGASAGPPSASASVSSGSSTPSPVTVTARVLPVSPAANVSVPGASAV